MRNYFIAPLLFFSVNALAANSFDVNTNMLKLESVVVNGVQYNDVAVRLNAYDVVSVGSNNNTVGGAVADTCTDANFTVAKFNAIAAGMTLEQVSQTIGCKYNPSKTVAAGELVQHSWLQQETGKIKFINIWFDGATNIIINTSGNGFKSRYGF
ncbi:MAG: hypothetical protein HOP02_09525 [Methylococcaceae bacterium]|nr:hypothetical protein [Methylococcaceae bacterium]